MSLRAQAPVESRPLVLVEREALRPGPREILVRVDVCAVCRTDLHVIEGDLALRRPGLVPGHQVVGSVAALGAEVKSFRVGDRVGIAWLREACGSCRFCQRGDENLCVSPHFTGWDADGGYADEALVPADFAHALPEGPSAREIAPLLCAGIIGYRAYRRSRIRPGGRLGLWGFGGSAHIAIQIARHFGCEVYVFSRGGEHRSLAQELGATWVGDSREPSPRPLDGAILFAPTGDLVLPALEALDRGATLAIAGIHLSDVPALDYQRHLFQERCVRSVTSNTRKDARELLELAATIPIRTRTRAYPLEGANEALVDLKHDRVAGSAVLAMGA
jgi:propanol-preferring alcohol dehydrogenase